MLKIKETDYQPSKLVLTEAEIRAAMAPVQKLAARLEETSQLFDEYRDTLSDDEDWKEHEEIAIADGSLDLYDAVVYFLNHEASTLLRAVNDDPDICKAREARRAEKAAATRWAKELAARNAEREKDKRIAELEAQLAAKTPKLTLAKGCRATATKGGPRAALFQWCGVFPTACASMAPLARTWLLRGRRVQRQGVLPPSLGLRDSLSGGGTLATGSSGGCLRIVHVRF